MELSGNKAEKSFKIIPNKRFKHFLIEMAEKLTDKSNPLFIQQRQK